MSHSRRLPDWELLATTLPDIAAPMRRYLDQLACVLGPAAGQRLRR
jgi:hypothetical protein